jgi:predicted helicase
VTGMDSMAMEDNDNYLSYICKKYRKNIINYVRLPMWISVFLFTLKYTKRAPSALWYNGIILSTSMIILDKYWEKKCDKVIDKYE